MHSLIFTSHRFLFIPYYRLSAHHARRAAQFLLVAIRAADLSLASRHRAALYRRRAPAWPWKPWPVPFIGRENPTRLQNYAIPVTNNTPQHRETSRLPPRTGAWQRHLSKWRYNLTKWKYTLVQLWETKWPRHFKSVPVSSIVLGYVMFWSANR